MARKTKLKKKVRCKQNVIKSRKENRREKRKEKKARKHAFFQRKNFVDNSHANEIIIPAPTKEQVKKVVKNDDVLQKQRNEMKQHKLEEKNAREMRKVRVNQLNEANRMEDKMIKKLEKQLKLNRRKSKTIPKSFLSDGLDYLLDICDENTRQQSIAAEQKLFEPDSDFEEDFALAAGKSHTKLNQSKNTSNMVAKNEKSFDSDSNSENSETESIGPVKRKAKCFAVNKIIKCNVGNDINNSDMDNSDVDNSEDTIGSEDDVDINHTTSVKDKLNTLSKVFLPSKKYKERKSNNSKNSIMNELFVTDASEKEETEYEEGLKISPTLGIKRKKVNAGKRKRLKTDIDNADNNIEELCSQELISNVEKKQKKKSKRNKGQISNELDSAAEDSESDFGSNVKINIPNEIMNEIKADRNKKVKFSDEDSNLSNSLGNEISDDEISNIEEEEESDDKLWEDIYGRTRDNKGNIIQQSSGKYVLPQLRSQKVLDSKKQENLLRLKKQMKGLLNRLAESNMNNIASQIEDLYMNHSRNDMNETLTSCILESLISPTLTPERLIMEHCILVTVLHVNVGTEVGAHFLQVLVKKFDAMFKLNFEVEDKQIDNIVLIISHLYNFKLFHSSLMYDILEILSEAFKEKEIDLILLILRSVGFTLRKDDPIALKNLILNLQKKSHSSAVPNNSRVKFMLDVLLAVKNNNMSKIPNYDHSHSEHLKKILRNFFRKGNFVTELKISFDDLRKAEERGRWWIVGSAWTGSVPGEDVKPNDTKEISVTKYSQQLLDLAKKQRMNTDVRRNIFCILMSAEDYLDAFEKFLHLGLKNLQEREIIYVIIDCCLQEKVFNPYYAYVAQKFCDFDRKYQMTLQFYLWDKLKELQSLALQQTSNLAKLITHLILEKGLPISVLKIIQFTDVDKPTVRFLRQVLLGILLHKSEENCLQVFQRVAVAPKLAMFRESLRLFIHHFLLRNTTAFVSDNLILLKERAKNADKVLSVSRSHVDF